MTCGVGCKSRPAVKPANFCFGRSRSGEIPEPTVKVRMRAGELAAVFAVVVLLDPVTYAT
jgi:hypothetical protein